MRKKNGKRIGVVPIALVAVFALAAFVSVGIWLAPNSAQAQGIPTASGDADQRAATGDDDCKVAVINEDGDPIGGPVEGGGCSVSGDSVDVVLENASNAARAVAVYTTGGDEYNVQAMDYTQTGPLGKKGVNEDLFEIDERGSKVGGGNSPGSQTVTVSRDMADAKGEIYLFVYHAIDAMNYAFRYTDPASDDGPTMGLNNGIPFSRISGVRDDTATPPAYNNTTQDALEKVEGRMAQAVNAAYIKAEEEAGPDGGLDAADFEDIDVAVDIVGVTTDEAVTVQTAKDRLALITGDALYTDPVEGTGVGSLKALVATANVRIAELENLIAVVNGTTGSVNSFYGSQADISVKVVFRALAAIGTDVDRDGAINEGEERSTLKIELTPSKTTGEATIIAVIKDANGTPLSGFVDLSVEGDADVLFEKSSLKTHRAPLNNNGSTGQVVVKGLSKTDPVRVKVIANYNNGELILDDYLSRLGDATEIDAKAYSCTESIEGRDNDSAADDPALNGGPCDYEIKSLTEDKLSSNDPKELVSIGAEDHFFIAGTSKDALGSTIDSLKSGKVTWEAADADARAALIDDKGTANTAVQIDGDAEPGTYNITVEDSGKDVSATIMITVAGDASTISVSCDPMMIPTDTGLTDCTVMVRDAADNIPSNLDTETKVTEEQDQVQISVRGSSDIKAELIGAKDNLVNLDEQGMANFAIQMPLDAVEGTQITVNVSTTIDDELLRNHTVVMYGDAAPEPMPMPMLLGAPSITSVMSDAAGMATVMLTPGDNASKHWVWAAPTDGSTGMWHGDSALAGDADMVTFSALTSGMNYWFIAVAGRGEGDASEWSAWSSWTVPAIDIQ